MVDLVLLRSLPGPGLLSPDGSAVWSPLWLSHSRGWFRRLWLSSESVQEVCWTVEALSLKPWEAFLPTAAELPVLWKPRVKRPPTPLVGYGRADLLPPPGRLPGWNGVSCQKREWEMLRILGLSSRTFTSAQSAETFPLSLQIRVKPNLFPEEANLDTKKAFMAKKQNPNKQTKIPAHLKRISSPLLSFLYVSERISFSGFCLIPIPLRV